MKVLVHNSIPGTTLGRFPLMLSVMQSMLDAKHEVLVLECDGVVPACMSALEQDPKTCLHCMTRAHVGRKLVEPRPVRRSLAHYLGARRVRELRAMRDELPSVPAIKAMREGRADIGYAALSTHAEVTRDPDPDLGDPRTRARIQNLLNTARISHEAWRAAIRVEKPDVVAMFNGRLAIDRGVLRACQEAGVRCRVYEVSSVANWATVYEDALPQDIGCVLQRVDALWDAAPADREEVASSFYRMRRAGVYGQTIDGTPMRANDRCYIQGQQSGLMPESWDASRKNIVIFGSSDDEYSAISEEWEHGIYPDQPQAIHAICRDLLGDARVLIHLRVHPRLIGMEREFIRRMLDTGRDHANLRVIPAESPVSSYALLDACDIAVSFRSTMTFEATFWGKPSLALANSVFRGRGASYDPTTHDEVVELLRAPLRPKDRVGALKYGYYRMRMGFEHPYFRGGDPDEGPESYRFKGDPIRIGERDMRAYRWRTLGRWARWM